MHGDLQVWPSSAMDISQTKLLHDVTLGGEDMQQLLSAINTKCLEWNFDVSIDFVLEGAFPCNVRLQLFGFFGRKKNL